VRLSENKDKDITVKTMETVSKIAVQSPQTHDQDLFRQQFDCFYASNQEEEHATPERTSNDPEDLIDFWRSVDELNEEPKMDENKSIYVNRVKLEGPANQDQDKNSKLHQWSNGSLKKAQLEDAVLNQIMTLKESGCEPPKWEEISQDNMTLKAYLTYWDQLEVVNGVLHKRSVSCDDKTEWKLVVPQHLRSVVFEDTHKHHDHPVRQTGTQKVMKLVGKRYWWTQWRTDVKRVCKKCVFCVTRPPKHAKRPPKHLANANGCGVNVPLELQLMNAIMTYCHKKVFDDHNWSKPFQSRKRKLSHISY